MAVGGSDGSGAVLAQGQLRGTGIKALLPGRTQRGQGEAAMAPAFSLLTAGVPWSWEIMLESLRAPMDFSF